MPKTHKLKIETRHFIDVIDLVKTFEIRKNDRDFKVGDVLELHAFCLGDFRCNYIFRRITYITDFMQKDGYVVLGIEPLKEDEL